MTGQEWATLAIAGTAAAWLTWRWRRRGLDEDGEHDSHGCGSCPKGVAPEAEESRASPQPTEARRPERPPPAHP
jgi:hypothetical protein